MLDKQTLHFSDFDPLTHVPFIKSRDIDENDDLYTELVILQEKNHARRFKLLKEGKPLISEEYNHLI